MNQYESAYGALLRWGDEYPERYLEKIPNGAVHFAKLEKSNSKVYFI